MDRANFNDLLLFVAVAEEQSFTKAAVRLGTSQSTLSASIKKLEERLGFRLLNRTTRNVAPTEAGMKLLESLVPKLDQLHVDIETLRHSGTNPSGTVRLSVSDHAFSSVIWRKLAPVLEKYPEIHVEFFIDNGFRDIVSERFDAGVRLGESVDKDMIAVRIGPDWRLIAVAAPEYIERNGTPNVPQDLRNHICINHRHRTDANAYAWEFSRNGQDIRVKVAGQLSFNATGPMIEAALCGYGIAYVAEDLVAAQLASGALVQVLDQWSPYFTGYYLYYPSRRQNSAAFTVILNALRE